MTVREIMEQYHEIGLFRKYDSIILGETLYGKPEQEQQ